MKNYKKFLFIFFLATVFCALFFAAPEVDPNDECSCGAPAEPAKLEQWEIAGDDFSHDPSIIFAQGKYWHFYTAIGVGLSTSVDGKTWKTEPRIFKEKLAWWEKVCPKKKDFNIWAPEIVYYNKTYYLYYSVSTFGDKVSAIGLASCKDLLKGKWKDLGVVIQSNHNNEYNCIDPGFICDGTNPWLTFGSWSEGIYIVRLDAKTMKPLASAKPVKLAAYTPFPATNAIEGVKIWRAPDQKFYLFASYDQCCQGVDSTYNVRVGKADTVTGPYIDREGKSLLEGGGTMLLDSDGEKYIGPGAGGVFRTANGLHAIAYHYYDGKKYGASTLAIHDIAIIDGWPSLVLQ